MMTQIWNEQEEVRLPWLLYPNMSLQKTLHLNNLICRFNQNYPDYYVRLTSRLSQQTFIAKATFCSTK